MGGASSTHGNAKKFLKIWSGYLKEEPTWKTDEDGRILEK
jgi:hypothetical protein